MFQSLFGCRSSLENVGCIVSERSLSFGCFIWTHESHMECGGRKLSLPRKHITKHSYFFERFSMCYFISIARKKWICRALPGIVFVDRDMKSNTANSSKLINLLSHGFLPWGQPFPPLYQVPSGFYPSDHFFAGPCCSVSPANHNKKILGNTETIAWWDRATPKTSLVLHFKEDVLQSRHEH
jgi:hypothetical protein